MERSGKGEGLHKRRAEAWGDSLRARGAAPPREAWFPYARASARRLIREGVAGRNVPQRWVAQDAHAAAAREEASSLHPERLKCSESLERNGGTAVIPEYVRLSTLVLRISGFYRDGGLEARRKSGAIGKLNLDVRAIVTVLKDGEEADGFVGEFFAFDHGLGLRAGRISHS